MQDKINEIIDYIQEEEQPKHKISEENIKWLNKVSCGNFEGVMEALIDLFYINQYINNIIAVHNSKSKDKIFLNVLDLMREIEIENIIEKNTGKKWDDIKDDLKGSGRYDN